MAITHSAGSAYVAQSSHDYFLLEMGAFDGTTRLVSWKRYCYRDRANITQAEYDSGLLQITNTNKTDIPVVDGALLDFSGDVGADYLTGDKYAWVATRWGKASRITLSQHKLKFRGIGFTDYVKANLSSQLFNPTGPFAIVVYFKHISDTLDHVLLSKSGAVPNTGWQLGVDAADTPYFEINIGTGQIVNAPTALDLTLPEHALVAVFEPSTSLTIYVDGQQSASAACLLASVSTNIDDLYMGLEFNPVVGRQANIEISGVQYYERVLTPSEAIALSGPRVYAARLGLVDIVAWWLFTEGSGLSLYEYVSQENSVINGCTWV